jgi:hypothetical protein
VLSGELLSAGGGIGLLGAHEERVGIVVLCGSALGSSFCGSYIGSQKKRMCVRKDCATASHVKPTSKATDIFEEYDSGEPLTFIAYKTDTDSVYVHPVKRAADFGPGLTRFLTMTRSVPAWTSLFSLSAEAQPQTEADAEEIVQRVERKLPMGLTPKKKKARFDVDSPGNKEDEFVMVKVPDIAPGADLATTLQASYPILQSNQIQLGEVIERIKSSSAQMAKEVSDDLESSEVRLDRLSRVVGEWPPEFATSNLCEVSTTLIQEVEASVARLVALEAKPTHDKKNFEAEIVRRVQEWITLELNPLYVLYTKLSTAIDKPADKFDVVLTRLLALEAKASTALPTVHKGQSASGFASMYPKATDSDDESKGSNMETDEVDFPSEIQELKDQLQAVREELMDDRVEISTIAFVSEVQSHAWMYANCVPSNTFYRLYDAVSLLTILTHSGASINDELTLDKNARSGSFMNKEAATFAASFALELPEIFGKETSSNQHRDDRELPAIPTHKEWDGGTGHSGAKNVIVKSLNKNVKNIRRHMNRYFSGDAKIVADTMLTDSQAFLSELCNWVSRHHYELLTRTASDEGTVWKLVAHDIRVIFQLLFEARGPGRNTGEPQHFFWGTLRAHKVMQELRAHNFSGHPDLGHALNQHLQDNAVMKSSFYTLVKEVETLKRDVAEAKKTADKALSGKK